VYKIFLSKTGAENKKLEEWYMTLFQKTLSMFDFVEEIFESFFVVARAFSSIQSIFFFLSWKNILKKTDPKFVYEHFNQIEKKNKKKLKSY
jgi:hypothetical protein